MTLQVDIETAELIKFNKKSDNSEYYKQEIYVHLCGRDGLPDRYPTRVEMYANRDPQSGNQVPLPIGKYFVCPSSFKVERGNLELGFVNLKPLNKK